MRYDIMIRDDQTLPIGYRYGTHVGGPGWSGYYVIRESDGSSCVARSTPESIEDRTAADFDEAIHDATREP